MGSVRIVKRALLALVLFFVAAPAQAQKPDVDAGAVLLVALSHFDNSPYRRTVVLAAPSRGGWHIGVVLNRPTGKKLGELFPDHASSQGVRGPVYFGGLYLTNVVMAMVRAPASPGPKSVRMMPGLWLVLDESAIDRIIEQRPNEARYYTGAIAWGPHMLREQIDRGELAALPADEKLLFLEDTSKLYGELAKRVGAAGAGLRVRY